MKANKALLVAVSIAAVWSTAACSRIPSANDVLQTYLTDWSHQDYKGMYQLLSEAAKKGISEKTFIQRYQAITSGIGTTSLHATSTSPSSVRPKGSSTTLNFSVTWHTNMTNPFTEKYHVNLSKGQNGWQIDWKPSLIFPQLKNGWQVHASATEPGRGNIVGADGRPLAENAPGEQVGLVPGKMKQTSATDLAHLLKLSTHDVQTKLHQSWVKPDLFVPVLTMPQATETGLEKQLLSIPGVLITPSSTPVRTYPMGSAAAHLTGYVGPITADELTAKRQQEGYTASDMIGQGGLEAAFEPELRGTPGGKIWVSDAAGNNQIVLASRQAQNGDTVKVTIDSQVQAALSQALANHIGSAVVLNPQTGAVLAMVSYPNYDPNQLVAGLGAAQWQALLKSGSAPLVNRAVSAIPPGSSLKPLVAGIGLTDGVLKPSTTYQGTENLKWQENSSWGSYYVTREPHPSGTDDLEHALVWSDNIYFAHVGLAIGARDFVAGLLKFGFERPLNFELAVNKAQVSNNGKMQGAIQLADSAYGQGQVLVSPLQLASMYTAFVNNGKVLQPYLTDSVTTADGTVVRTGAKKVLFAQAISPSAVATVASDLRQVVANPTGTAHAIANIPGWVVSGKTGTAQKARGGSDWGWFAAWANQPGHSQPKYLVVMALANTQNQGGSHQAVVQVANFFSHLPS